MTAEQITIKAMRMGIDPFLALHNELTVTEARIRCLMKSDESEDAALLVVQDITRALELKNEIQQLSAILS